MKVRALEALPEALVVEPDVYEDDRGYFLETWRHERYAEVGIGEMFVQDNHSRSLPGVVRGLHFQYPVPQAKLVYVLQGEILDVLVDVRVGSPRFGHWSAVPLTSTSRRQVYVPRGFAHGFAVLGDGAEVHYKCSAPYRPGHEHVLLWNDPDVGIEWPFEDPALSVRDRAGTGLEALRHQGLLPRFSA